MWLTNQYCYPCGVSGPTSVSSIVGWFVFICVTGARVPMPQTIRIHLSFSMNSALITARITAAVRSMKINPSLKSSLRSPPNDKTALDQSRNWCNSSCLFCQKICTWLPEQCLAIRLYFSNRNNAFTMVIFTQLLYRWLLNSMQCHQCKRLE